MPTHNPRNRRKPADKLHNIDLKLWITESQESKLIELADKRDIPKGVLAREALLIGLDIYLSSLHKQVKAA